MENPTRLLERYESEVKDGKIDSFWVTIRDNSLQIKSAEHKPGKTVFVAADMLESIQTFFYGVDTIQYGTHDYANLKSFMNARDMLDKLLKKDSA